MEDTRSGLLPQGVPTRLRPAASARFLSAASARRRLAAVFAGCAVLVTALFALVATITALLLASPWPAVARPLRLLILAVAYLAAVAVVVGVIGVRFHYFTDTAAGAAVGTGTVCGLALVLDLIPGVWPSRMGLSRLRRPA